MSMSYLGAFGYNESPDELGGPMGFWRFANYEALETAYQTSSSLDEVFQELGLVTYSKIIWVVDQQGNAVFHLLVLSVSNDLYLRQYDLMEHAVKWLKTQGKPNLNARSLGIAGIQRETLEKRKQEHEIHLQQLKLLSQRREQCTKILRFLKSDSDVWENERDEID
jgi:hypothetical protein